MRASCLASRCWTHPTRLLSSGSRMPPGRVCEAADYWDPFQATGLSCSVPFFWDEYFVLHANERCCALAWLLLIGVPDATFHPKEPTGSQSCERYWEGGAPDPHECTHCLVGSIWEALYRPKYNYK